MAYGIVYEIFCTKTGLRYVGQTTSELRKRWNGHIVGALKQNLGWEISKAIREHGPESFQPRVLCECESSEELNEAERRFIRELNTITPNGYNVLSGGSGQDEETRKRISQRTREAMAKIDPETRLKQKERQRQAMSDPTLRSTISKRTLAALQRPEVQKNFRQMISDPINKRKISVATKEAMQDPEIRKRHLERIAEYQSELKRGA